MIFYSRDDEEFQYESLGDLIDNEEPELGDFYYTAEFENVKASDVVNIGNVDSLIEDFSETLSDIVGEFADGAFLDVTNADRLSLQLILEDWVKQAINLNKFWTIVGKSTEHKIEEGDL